MSKYTVFIKFPDYMAQWLRHDYWNEEEGRVVFPKGSAPRAVMLTVLRRAPQFYSPVKRDGALPVEVPSAKGLRASEFNYLTPRGMSSLVSACRRMIQMLIFKELSPLFYHEIQITDAVYDFMDKHGIEPSETNWETIRQMYYRIRNKNLRINQL